MSELGALQALVTGAIMGSLMGQDHLSIEVEPVLDGDGYTNMIRVVGKESGERLLITVEKVPLTP